MSGGSKCEFCANYLYDEVNDCYTCDVSLDEDEFARFMSATFYNCPYYEPDDEYGIVRKQN